MIIVTIDQMRLSRWLKWSRGWVIQPSTIFLRSLQLWKVCPRKPITREWHKHKTSNAFSTIMISFSLQLYDKERFVYLLMHARYTLKCWASQNTSLTMAHMLKTIFFQGYFYKSAMADPLKNRRGGVYLPDYLLWCKAGS